MRHAARAGWLWIPAALAATGCLLLAVGFATLSVGMGMPSASADTIPCYNWVNGQFIQVPCPTTTTPAPTTAPPTTARPPVTKPPVTQPPVSQPPVTLTPTVTTPPTTASTTTTVPPTTTTVPVPTTQSPALFGSKTPTHGSVPPSTTSTTVATAVVGPGGVASPLGGKGKGMSKPFLGAMVLDGMLLLGIAGYVVNRRIRSA